MLILSVQVQLVQNVGLCLDACEGLADGTTCAYCLLISSVEMQRQNVHATELLWIHTTVLQGGLTHSSCD
jgi:hypothetical protein